jgi:hypothetical protein
MRKKYLCLNFYILAGPFKQAVSHYTVTQLLLIFFYLYSSSIFNFKKARYSALTFAKIFFEKLRQFLSEGHSCCRNGALAETIVAGLKKKH